MRKILLLGLFFGLTACGSNNLASTTKKDTTAKDTPQKSSCPAAPNPEHIVTMTLARGLPGKIAIKLKDETDYHASECADRTQTGMKITFQRQSLTTVAIHFDHNKAFTFGGVSSLPANQYFEVYDLKDCTGTPALLYKTADPAPIAWRFDSSLGATCANHIQGDYQITVPGTDLAE